MPFSTKRFLLLLLFPLTGCYSIQDNPLGEQEFTSGELVVYGVLTPSGGEVMVTKTLPPNVPYFDSDVSVGATASVVLINQRDDNEQHQFEYDTEAETYRLRETIDPTSSYYLRVSLADFPVVISDQLTFAPAFDHVAVEFRRRENSPATDVEIITGFSGETYHLIQPLSADSTADLDRASPFLYTDFDDLFLDQCGIFNQTRDIAYASVCFSDSTANLSLVHEYARRANEDRFAELDSAPSRIGISVASIKKQDYLFFKSLNRNQNPLDDYLVSREPLTLTNVSGGYGYVILARAQEVWFDL